MNDLISLVIVWIQGKGNVCTFTAKHTIPGRVPSSVDAASHALRETREIFSLNPPRYSRSTHQTKFQSSAEEHGKNPKENTCTIFDVALLIRSAQTTGLHHLDKEK